jgi:hypothetical protein
VIARCATTELLAQAESLLEQRQVRDAFAAFDRAQNSGADFDRCAAGRWMANMLAGNFEAAWQESDEIRRRGAPDPQRLWQGEDIYGKVVIVRCLHGLGDAVQMFRYIPLLCRGASRLIVEVPPSLMELAAMFEDVEVVTWGNGTPPPPEWDVQVEITELPYLFRTQLHELPIAEHYLSPVAGGRDEIRPSSEDSLRVGLVWSSGEWNPARSVPFSLLGPVMDVPGCEYWNLQGGPARSDWKQTGLSWIFHDADDCADSIVRLAALIAQLDLVVTPDTFAAHLAGALGTPVWVMLQFAADWRWMDGRSDSPWYPSMRLFRQPAKEDWSSVIAQISSRLREAAARKVAMRTAA